MGNSTRTEDLPPKNKFSKNLINASTKNKQNKKLKDRTFTLN